MKTSRENSIFLGRQDIAGRRTRCAMSFELCGLDTRRVVINASPMSRLREDENFKINKRVMSATEYDDYDYDSEANLTDAEYEDLVRATLWPQTVEKSFVVVLMSMMVVGVIGNTLVVVVVISKRSMGHLKNRVAAKDCSTFGDRLSMPLQQREQSYAASNQRVVRNGQRAADTAGRRLGIQPRGIFVVNKSVKTHVDLAGTHKVQGANETPHETQEAEEREGGASRSRNNLETQTCSAAKHRSAKLLRSSWWLSSQTILQTPTNQHVLPTPRTSRRLRRFSVLRWGEETHLGHLLISCFLGERTAPRRVLTSSPQELGDAAEAEVLHEYMRNQRDILDDAHSRKQTRVHNMNWSQMNIFLTNLACADLLILIFCLPPTVINDVTKTFWFSEVFCKSILFFQLDWLFGCVFFMEMLCSFNLEKVEELNAK
ncbi:hypothetical protein ANCCEY_12893 [Ancylostoma ceylanicum]|uniref:G-protein coupled receptors family 1 profile domain-containing protein n=1 Tax=Ancylostoma ceylanicum TaxID=53326 RepID=A0A0D6LDM9_9BILA|nr:hypothetical protein ANCCEY_12893 [Ancylostoma ceylanicum]